MSIMQRYFKAKHNKPRHSQPAAAATLTSSRACAGRYNLGHCYG